MRENGEGVEKFDQEIREELKGKFNKILEILKSEEKLELKVKRKLNRTRV